MQETRHKHPRESWAQWISSPYLWPGAGGYKLESNLPEMSEPGKTETAKAGALGEFSLPFLTLLTVHFCLPCAEWPKDTPQLVQCPQFTLASLFCPTQPGPPQAHLHSPPSPSSLFTLLLSHPLAKEMIRKRKTNFLLPLYC